MSRLTSMSPHSTPPTNINRQQELAGTPIASVAQLPPQCLQGTQHSIEQVFHLNTGDNLQEVHPEADHHHRAHRVALQVAAEAHPTTMGTKETTVARYRI